MHLLFLFVLFLMATPMYAQDTYDFSQQYPSHDVRTEIKLFPNPAHGETVKIVSNGQKLKAITAFDVFGKPVLREKMYNNTLNISALKPGIYVLQIEQGQKTINRKLIVK